MQVTDELMEQEEREYTIEEQIEFIEDIVEGYSQHAKRIRKPIHKETAHSDIAQFTAVSNSLRQLQLLDRILTEEDLPMIEESKC